MGMIADMLNKITGSATPEMPTPPVMMPPIAPAIPMAPAPAAPPAMVANDIAQQPPADVPFDLVGTANKVFGNGLSKYLVKKRMINQVTGQESMVQVGMPVASVSIGGPKFDESRVVFVGGNADAHDSVTLTVNLRDEVGNYDITSLNHAIQEVLGKTAVLKGKVEFEKDLAEQKLDHGDVWKELKPMLEVSGKFTPQELGLLTEYFETHRSSSANNPDWSHYEIQHTDGKVQVHIRPAVVEGDAKEATSGEARTVEYFNTHKDAILTKMRDKISALNVLTPEELASLDLNAAIMKADWGDQPTIEFGSKATAPATAMGQTALAKIDTDKIAACFKSAFIESGEQEPGKPGVPWVFGRIADGDMVRELIYARLGHTPDPKIVASLSHPMFNSSAEQKTHTDDLAKKDIMHLGNVIENSKPHELKLTFDLPHGTDITALRESIVRSARDLAPKPQPGIAA